MKNAKQQKQVNIQARIAFKNDPRKVVYRVLSSDGRTVYNTFFFNGKATSCKCLSKKPCYHMTGCQAREDARQPAPTCTGMVPTNYRETSSLSSNKAFSILR